MLIGGIFLTIVGRSRSSTENGFKYYFSKKYFTNNPNLDFTFQVKNIKKSTNILEYTDMKFQLNDKKTNKTIFTKSFFIPKQTFGYEEFYTEYIIVDKPPKGKYSAKVLFGQNKNKEMILKFSLK